MHTKLKSYVWYKMFAHFFFTLFEDLDFKCFEDHDDFRNKNNSNVVTRDVCSLYNNH